VDRFPIYDRMQELVEKTIEATQLQLKHERKKLRKIKYGS
jgi:hypothetical protein